MGTSLSIVANVGLAGASLSTSSLTFAAQTLETTSIPQVVTLTNTGDIVLIISGLNFSGVNSGDVPIESNTCGNTVAAGASCTIAISFSPTATGACAAALQILSNVESSPTVLQLSGTGN
jgi:trimeric autotransporter adhesin